MKKNDFPAIEDIVETVREPLLVLDMNLNILSANRSFYTIFNVEQGETIGHLIFDVGNKQWDIPALRKLLEEILPAHKRFDNYEVEHDFPAIGHKTMLLNARQVYRKDVGTQMILLAIEDITERKKVEKALEANEAKYRELVQNANSIILRMDTKGKVTFFNEFAQMFFGYTEEEMLGCNVVGTIVPETESSGRDLDSMIKDIGIHPEKYINNENENMRRNGERVWVAWTNKAIRDGSGKIGEVLCIGNDITRHKRLEGLLEESEERYRRLFETANDGILLLEKHEGKITHANPAATEMLGYSKEECIGKKLQNIGVSLDTGDIQKIMQTLDRNGIIYYDNVPLKTKTGQYIDTDIYMVDRARLVQCNIRDITERKHMAEKLQHLAYHDSLTDLPNRTLFFDRVNQAIARAEPMARIVSVLITNIDRFKSINDTYGSETGDSVLNEIAGRLSTSVRKGDTVARLSNDEFGIALLDIAHPDDIIMVLEKIIKDISYPLKVNGDELVLTFRTGVSLYPNDGNNASELLKAAGLALATAKKERMKPYQFFTEDLNTKASELLLMEKNLHTAITNKEFILHYQPYWDITTKKMVGMEALVRWQSQNNGLVPPGKFIPILEDTGRIMEVGEWILRETMRQVKEWQNNGYPVVPVSVNLSLIQFWQKDLAEMVKRIMGECDFYPSLLTLEITESAFMQDIEFTRSVLTAMKEIGCSISIDDFGTGYSSLSYLKRFPIDNLKIDISFIREVVRDPDSASIVMAIINMAHALQLKTIAEGVETEEQWNILRLFRCDMGQGFYLGKPLPAEEFEKMLV